MRGQQALRRHLRTTVRRRARRPRDRRGTHRTSRSARRRTQAFGAAACDHFTSAEPGARARLATAMHGRKRAREQSKERMSFYALSLMESTNQMEQHMLHNFL